MTKKNISFSVVIFLVGAFFVGGILWATTKVVYRDRKIEKEIETLRQEAERIKNDNKNLSERIAYFETPQFQEKVAKEKLNLQKPDESVIVINPSPSLKKDSEMEAPKTQEEVQSLPNYKKWWNYFFAYSE